MASFIHSALTLGMQLSAFHAGTARASCGIIKDIQRRARLRVLRTIRSQHSTRQRQHIRVGAKATARAKSKRDGRLRTCKLVVPDALTLVQILVDWLQWGRTENKSGCRCLLLVMLVFPSPLKEEGRKIIKITMRKMYGSARSPPLASAFPWQRPLGCCRRGLSPWLTPL